MKDKKEYSIFKNAQEHTEYIQIFIFSEIIILKKPVDKVTIHTYEKFELTDTLINSFNKWIKDGFPEFELIEAWFDLREDEYIIFRENFGNKYKPKVSLWSDREKTPYYKEKLQDSFLFENHIADLLSQHGLEIGAYLTPEGQYDLGENALGIEIKNDTLIQKWGNVYIEYQEKSNAGNYDYINSGILKDDKSKYFLLGTTEAFYIFRKERLIEIFHEEIKNLKNGTPSKRGISFKQIATSKGYVYPVKNATEDIISLEQMVAEIKKEL